VKIRPENPFVAVKATGGSTFEPALGWWTQAGDENQLHLGSAFASHRDALYIPTIQKTGVPVDEGTVGYLKQRARELGLDRLTQAAGIWVLSTTGEIQAETIWIAYSGNGMASQTVDREKLAELAAVVKNSANQDAVAWEEDGELKFTGFILGTVRREVALAPKKNPSRFWIVPTADLETVEVRELLAQNGEYVLATGQKWGARWDHLEAEVIGAVETYRVENPAVKIYGVKLEGECPNGWNAKTIQRYSGQGVCPLEAVAEIVWVGLNEYQKLVAVNLKNRMAGLIAASLPQGVIDAIRLTDRCSQGVTPDQEAAAVRAWGKRVVAGDHLTIIRMRECKCAPVTDRFYGQYKNILILGEDGESNFYGDAEIAVALKKAFPSYTDADGNVRECWMRVMEGASESFWGGFVPQQKVEEFLRAHFA